MAYCEIIVQSLVPVPERRIPLNIDLIAEIVVLYKLQINSDNPIEHILALFERWHPLLKNSKLTEAHNVLSVCVNSLVISITSNNLKLVSCHINLHMLLLKSLPAAADITNKVWDKNTFYSCFKHACIALCFVHQHELIGDLKMLLDSAEYRIYSSKISEFLKIDYKAISICFLCSSSQENEFFLMPGNEEFSLLNKPNIRILMDSLFDLVISQFFKSQFKHNVAIYLKSTNATLAIDLDIIYKELWVPTLSFISSDLSNLSDLTIPLISIEEYFGIYICSPEQIKDEINHLLPFLKIVGIASQLVPISTRIIHQLVPNINSSLIPTCICTKSMVNRGLG